ncbi:MAG: hypothetical protein ACE5J7_02325 [Candidatus Aenigmatarchaeota archaeon]
MDKDHVKDILKQPIKEAKIDYDESWVSEIADFVMDPDSLVNDTFRGSMRYRRGIVMGPDSFNNGAYRGCIVRYRKDLLDLFIAATDIAYADAEEKEIYMRALDKVWTQVYRRGLPTTCKNCKACHDDEEEEEFEEEYYSEDELPF